MTVGQSTRKSGIVAPMPQSQPSPTARFQPPAVRQRQILDAAAALAVEHGLDNVSVAQVAKSAGIAKGSIYLHYASRTELIDALQSDLWHKMLDRPNEIIANDDLSWSRRMDDIVRHLVDFSMENEDLYHAIFHAAGAQTEEPWTESRQLLRRLLFGGNDAGEFQVGAVEITADFLLHAYAGPCYHGDDRAHVTHEIQQIFRRVVGAERLT